MITTEILDWYFVVINYVFVFSLPGDVGNFITRALGLISDQWYGYVPADSSADDIHLSINDKVKEYSYVDYSVDNWAAFESKLVPYAEVTEHHCLPTNSYSIWNKQASYKVLENDITGTDDQQHVFYIDPGLDFKWALLNAFYKQICFDVSWMRVGMKMLKDNRIHKLSLSNIITSQDTCIAEIQKLADITGATILPAARLRIADLWNQWHDTTLKNTEFSEFATSIGFVS